MKFGTATTAACITSKTKPIKNFKKTATVFFQS